MQLIKKHSNLGLAYFLLVGTMGVFLRLFYIFPVPATYKFVVHAHSHVALLGWVYIALITLIYCLHFFEVKKSALYKRIIWFTNICIMGMLLSFPVQGYALFSIIFSTLFLIASYFLTWFFFKNIPEKRKKMLSWRCIKASLWYMIFSSIGPWAVGGIMATLGKATVWYKIAIYFYLHFQYNAWFIMALIGILFFIVEKSGLTIDRKKFKMFFLLLNLGVILSFFLSVLWIKPPVIYYILAGTGAILQLVAFLYFFRIIQKIWPDLKMIFSPIVQYLSKLCGILLIVKIGFQLISALPYFANLAFLYQDFVIGYLHWTFLGVVSLSLLAFLEHFKLIKLNWLILTLYHIGFIFSEILIFYKGMSLWLRWPRFAEQPLLLVFISALVPLAVGILLIRNYYPKSKV
ncbi:hypothetical protein [Christiangramia forsetii]|uniref:Membrane protein n=1 Tax=Christiangramia forsetii (strain DSM 17595 / CGMCC 1.15422 / KT0803) TaxID=411154 RepID=A0M179_CHRFK|nr:hypothetical protein [Christiangramia forsetii]CAL66374.1 membrane protein [Christiangramia forsetii KT0803]